MDALDSNEVGVVILNDAPPLPGRLPFLERTRRIKLEALQVVTLLVPMTTLPPWADEPEITDRSIANLPFETLGRAEATAFTDGIHGDILTRLSRIPDLSVTSRTSVMQYRNPERPLPEIARQLGVAWMLQGDARSPAARYR